MLDGPRAEASAIPLPDPAARRLNRVTLLEAEMKEVYLREAELQTKLAQQEQVSALREKALATERDELVRRADDLQRQLATTRRR